MPISCETILSALLPRLSELPATDLCGDVLSERVPAEGLLILRDGESGEPGQCCLPGATAKGTSIAESLTDDAHLGTLTEPPATVFHEGTGAVMNTLRMMLCVRFPLLLCNVEGLLHARGIGAVGLHDTGRWKNNRAEKSHLPVRRRERAMQSFQRMPSLQISPSSTPLASILSTRSAACTQGQISGRTASLLLPSGVSYARQNVQTHCPFGDKSESV